jgi:alpha-tubulin suppressor-like RCC1 family protein
MGRRRRLVAKLLTVAGILGLAACSGPESGGGNTPAAAGGLPGSGGDAAPTATLTLQVDLPDAGGSGLTRGLAIGTAANVASVTVDVLRGTTPLVTGQALTLTSGVYSATFANLPLGVVLTFKGHALNASSVELFSGQVDKVLTGVGDQVALALLPVDDGAAALLPRITSLTVPSPVASGSTTTVVTIAVAGAASETLTVAITSGGGTFALSPSGGLVTLSGGTGSVTATYTAPATVATYTHTVRVTNAQRNYVDRQFQIQVCTACAPAVANTAPSITGLSGTSNGGNTQITWTATVTDDAVGGSALTYAWSYDGGLSFTAANTNPAVLLAYTTAAYGNLKLTVTDAGGLTAAASFFMAKNAFTASSTVNVGLTPAIWKQVAAGAGHTLAIRQDGTLWAWGQNINGQLGLGFTDTSGAIPGLVPTQVGTDTNWAEVRAGVAHSVARKTDGSVWTWGYNPDGELGLGNFTTGPSLPTLVTNANLLIASVPSITAIAAGDYHVLALRSDGTLWTWGYNGNNELGQGNSTSLSNPTRIGTATSWSAIAAGGRSSMGLQGGSLFAWGRNVYGQLGIGNFSDASTPQPVVGAATDWAKIAMGVYDAFGIKGGTTEPGKLYGWGYNNEGEVGNGESGTSALRNAPTPVGLPSDVWLAVSAGDGIALAIKSATDTSAASGTLWAWGYNAYGQLGAGDTGNRATPTQIGTLATWRSVAAGAALAYNAFAIQTDNSLWAWGRNSTGQLGVGSASSAASWPVPTQVKQ